MTAVAELVGCYLPYLWLRKNGSAWLLIPALVSLSLFAWLLTLHPTASGRVYAAYGGVYVAAAVIWLWAVDGVNRDGEITLSVEPGHVAGCFFSLDSAGSQHRIGVGGNEQFTHGGVVGFGLEKALGKDVGGDSDLP